MTDDLDDIARDLEAVKRRYLDQLKASEPEALADKALEKYLDASSTEDYLGALVLAVVALAKGGAK